MVMDLYFRINVAFPAVNAVAVGIFELIIGFAGMTICRFDITSHKYLSAH